MPDVAPVIHEADLACTPEAAFDAFTDPDHVRAWFAHEAEIDLRPGGAWRFTWPGGMSAAGHVIEAERPDAGPGRYVWTWEESIHPGGVMPSDVRIDYTFTPVEGGTRLRIEESGHDTAEIRDMNEEGVAGMIPTLRAWVEQGTRVDWSTMPTP